jgi:hypothetical protein
MEGLAHAPPEGEALGELILFADYPKMGWEAHDVLTAAANRAIPIWDICVRAGSS